MLQGATLLLLAVLVTGCEFSQSLTVSEAMRNRADESFDLNSLRQSLAFIHAWHRDNGTQIPSLLKPGVDGATLERYFDEIGCKPPTEVRELWQWRNGHEDTGAAQWFVWYHQFLPIEAAFKERKSLRWWTAFGWHKHWIPVFQFQDEWYFVECSNEPRDASPVMFYSTEDGFRHSYSSLTTYLATIARAMRTGAIDAEGEDRDMKENIAALARIHAELNPGLPFPYYVPSE